ncbi:hypothetical protein H0H93_006662, partial [Arthromyces matolae]
TICGVSLHPPLLPLRLDRNVHAKRTWKKSSHQSHCLTIPSTTLFLGRGLATTFVPAVPSALVANSLKQKSGEMS